MMTSPENAVKLLKTKCTTIFLFFNDNRVADDDHFMHPASGSRLPLGISTRGRDGRYFFFFLGGGGVDGVPRNRKTNTARDESGRGEKAISTNETKPRAADDTIR